MPLTILSDPEVHSLLLSLTRSDIAELQHNLSEALHDYSTGTQDTTAGCSANQPHRMSIPAANKQTTLFMPASSSTSRGIKIVTLSTPPVSTPTSSLSKLSIDSPRSGSPTPKSPSIASSRSSTTLGSFTSSLSSVPSADPSVASSQSTVPRGSLTLLTATGIPYAFLDAEELTAFRTALAATMIFNRRSNVHSITVFGAGLQAKWHIRLALMLRGPEIHHIDIINRSFARGKALMHEFYTSPEWEGLRTANKKLAFSVVSSEYGEYPRLLKEHVRKADALFLCTPSTTPLFPAEFLTSTEGRKKGRYVSAIGSYRPHMCEIHPDILAHAVAPHHKHHLHHHRHADKGGVVVVDSLEACLREAGEIIQAGLSADQLVEIGELLMVKKASLKEIETGTGEGEVGLRKWLESGNVIYKSVGIGLMDICVGEDLVALAMQKGIGTRVEGF